MTVPITFIQTADAFRYADMLAATSRTVRVYAQARGLAYEQFLGLKVGAHPWHACFNRIFMLSEMLDRGVQGWVCHMDADAWIDDVGFDVSTYLADRLDRAAIFTHSKSSDAWWDVNDGVFFINLDHPQARGLIRDWKAATLAVFPQIEHVTGFPPGGPDDQSLLHNLLEAGDYSEVVELADPAVMNAPDALFIRQNLRSLSATFDVRLAKIREAVARVLDDHLSYGESETARARQAVEGLYLAILDRRPDGASEPYVQAVLASGFREGVQRVARVMIDSREFQASARGAG